MQVHDSYVNKALDRCLLSERAKPLHQVIESVFNLILKFHAQISTPNVKLNNNTNLDTSNDMYSTIHSNVSSQVVEKTYSSFKKFAKFMYAVLQKLYSKGFDPHIESLLTQWNYNQFYT